MIADREFMMAIATEATYTRLSLVLLDTFSTSNAASAQAQLKQHIGQTQIIVAQLKAGGSISLRAPMTAADLDALDGVLSDFGYGLEY